MNEDIAPAWAEPCRRFIIYVGRIVESFRATARTAILITALPSIVENLAGLAPEKLKEGFERDLQAVYHAAQLAKTEIEDDFAILRSNSIIGAWGALEAMVEDLAISVAAHNPSVLDHPAIAKIRIPRWL